jgi:hypothetical protein
LDQGLFPSKNLLLDSELANMSILALGLIDSTVRAAADETDDLVSIIDASLANISIMGHARGLGSV